MREKAKEKWRLGGYCVKWENGVSASAKRNVSNGKRLAETMHMRSEPFVLYFSFFFKGRDSHTTMLFC